jgi:hypothetical protein
MRRVITFDVNVTKNVTKRKDKKSYLVINAPDALEKNSNNTKLPKKLQLWVWWNPKDSGCKPVKYQLPSSSRLRVKCRRPYALAIDFDIAYHLGFYASKRMRISIKNEAYGSLKEITGLHELTQADLGSYQVCIDRIISNHTSFFCPAILTGRPHSKLHSITLNGAKDVCRISEMMEEMNQARPDEPQFEVVSVTHMGYAFATQHWSDKYSCYTLFYRMNRPSYSFGVQSSEE